MAAEIPRRGAIRPVRDLPDLASTIEWIEVEGADGRFYRATSTQVGGNSGFDMYNQYIAFQAPFSSDFDDLKGHAVTPSGGVSIVGGQAVFDGTGQLSYSTSEALNLRDSDFWIEGWFTSSQNQQYTTLFERDINLAGGYTLVFNIDSASDGRIAFYQNAASQLVKTATGGYNDGVRHHVAVVRTGLTFYLFVDGLLLGTNAYASLSVFAASTGALILGNSPTASRALIGEMDNWRMGKGIPGYTVPFVVPTPPFPSS